MELLEGVVVWPVSTGLKRALDTLARGCGVGARPRVQTGSVTRDVMTRRTLAALLSTALCVSVGACDGLADLFGRLSVDTVSTREGAGFVGPSLLRLDAGNARLAPACARSPALGPRLAGQFGRDVAGTGPLSSFWAQVEARGRVRSAVSSIVMSGKNRARGNRVIVKDVPSKDKPSAGLSGIVQRVSHQVLVLNASYEPLSVVSAHRALALLFSEKASTVVNKATWVSAGGQSFDVPSVVSLRRYVKVTNRMPPLNRKTILMRDNGVCQYCDAPADNIDHVIPRSKGGESLAAYVLCATSPILGLFDCASALLLSFCTHPLSLFLALALFSQDIVQAATPGRIVWRAASTATAKRAPPTSRTCPA